MRAAFHDGQEQEEEDARDRPTSPTFSFLVPGPPPPAIVAGEPVSRRTWRRSAYEFLIDNHGSQWGFKRASVIYHVVMGVSVLMLVIVDRPQHLEYSLGPYATTQLVITIIWLFEHFLRLWCCVERGRSIRRNRRGNCEARIRYFVRPLVIIETLALSFLIIDIVAKAMRFEGMSTLRILRTLSIYRIELDFHVFGPVVRACHKKQHELMATLIGAGIVVTMAAVIVFYIEEPYNPQFSSVFVSIYWCIITLTTVGYGDMVPLTPLGRTFALVVSLFGPMFFGLFAGILGEGFSSVARSDASEPALVGAAAMEERLQRQEERITALQKDMQEALGLLRTLSHDKMQPKTTSDVSASA